MKDELKEYAVRKFDFLTFASVCKWARKRRDLRPGGDMHKFIQVCPLRVGDQICGEDTCPYFRRPYHLKPKPLTHEEIALMDEEDNHMEHNIHKCDMGDDNNEHD